MKVKEIIEFLSKLDQDKDFWINYDSCVEIIPPIPEYIAKGDYKIIKEGDYVVDATTKFTDCDDETTNDTKDGLPILYVDGDDRSYES